MKPQLRSGGPTLPRRRSICLSDVPTSVATADVGGGVKTFPASAVVNRAFEGKDREDKAHDG